jgi:hypothetical protein
MLRLAAVETAEQAQELRVRRCGGSPALTGVGCGRVAGDRGGLEGMAGGAVDRRRWRLEEDGAARRRSRRQLRVAAAGCWASGGGGGW